MAYGTNTYGSGTYGSPTVYRFTPPALGRIRNTDIDPQGARATNALSRHFQYPQRAGPSVWVLANGTLTEEQPYPVSGAVDVYYSGHVYTVSAAQKATLEAAGYTVDTV